MTARFNGNVYYQAMKEFCVDSLDEFFVRYLHLPLAPLELKSAGPPAGSQSNTAAALGSGGNTWRGLGGTTFSSDFLLDSDVFYALWSLEVGMLLHLIYGLKLASFHGQSSLHCQQRKFGSLLGARKLRQSNQDPPS